jgi:hypothetical protein
MLNKITNLQKEIKNLDIKEYPLLLLNPYLKHQKEILFKHLTHLSEREV